MASSAKAPISTISIPLSPTYPSFASAATVWSFPACCRIRSGSAAPTRPWYSSGSMPERCARARRVRAHADADIGPDDTTEFETAAGLLRDPGHDRQASACVARKEHGGYGQSDGGQARADH